MIGGGWISIKRERLELEEVGGMIVGSESRHWWEQEHTGGRIGLERAQLAEVRLL